MNTIEAMIELIHRAQEYIQNNATGHIELNWCEGEVRSILYECDKIKKVEKVKDS